MAYGFIEDVPANEEMYEQVKARIGEEAPKGLVAHIVVQREGGLRYIDVWDTEADWKRFHDEKVDPAVIEVLASYGITPDPSMVQFEEIDVVDTWLGSSTKAATPA